ncbi:hypothetical protein H310_05799 [Aphanomyces invadans]|uniref:DUF4110 domain-containing protein n=1 Tax=Aphanomyces invadans TaxID=157072 RepID=A0A024U8N4_9STRA|nr:hypothetical protein H310_05799 [Aphanomyces invadans]ETW02247.1 hypothetical protein H310_05799 [Aphanomyces invadans]|eukprot:XP_008868852.1 hypothetical protein H310_05799 [Aphanomyces invadans]
MAKKDKKSGAAKKEEKKARQELKQQKINKKKASKEAKDAGEEDIEAILQEFMKKDAAKVAITIVPSLQPSPRANFSLSSMINGDLLMFGGEYFDGECNVCYNELYRWNIEANEWKLISSPNTPPPRCSHQSVVYRDHLYVFGGEFATADQFYHYRDLWRLDLKTNSWECLDGKGGPSPRSGHRMTVWRNYLVVFGGFYEAARETKWFNDLFLFNFADLKWKKISFPVHKATPAPRSGCQLAVMSSNDTIFMYGGYAKVKNVGEKAEGKVYTDIWALHMGPIIKSQDPTWEKLSRKGHAPSPRSGATMTVYKNRAILFGGVFDEEGRRHELKSVFYNDMFAYDMERKRWYEYRLRNKKEPGAKRRRMKTKVGDAVDEDDEGDDTSESDVASDNEGSDGESAMEEAKRLNQFGYVGADGNIVYLEDDDEEEKDNEGDGEMPKFPTELADDEESKDEEANDAVVEPVVVVPPVATEQQNDVFQTDKEQPPQVAVRMPLPRINPALIVRGNTFFVYGGVLEDGDREITLDDCWSLDLKRMDEWVEVLPGTMAEQLWKGEVSDTEDSTYDSDDDDDEEDEEFTEYIEPVDEGDEADKPPAPSEAALAVARGIDVLDGTCEETKKSKKKNDRKAIRQEIETLQDQLQLADETQTPLPGENLRDFFARTAKHWATQVAQLPDTFERQLSVKDIKREGFALAEVRYNELLPILERLNELEAEQKRAEEDQKDKKTAKKGGRDASSRR